MFYNEPTRLKLVYPFAGLATLAAASSCQHQKKEEAKPYNIVYIMTDDHTAQMMSCYDTRYMETPNLDRIANDGVRFTNSFVANSLSGPSRACMITGKHSCANNFMITLPVFLIVHSRLFLSCFKRWVTKQLW